VRWFDEYVDDAVCRFVNADTRRSPNMTFDAFSREITDVVVERL
jgi:hypothetical protein